jgi:hypothetical protein
MGNIETAKAQRIKENKKKERKRNRKSEGGGRINKVPTNTAQLHLFVGCSSHALLFSLLSEYGKAVLLGHFALWQ